MTNTSEIDKYAYDLEKFEFLQMSAGLSHCKPKICETVQRLLQSSHVYQKERFSFSNPLKNMHEFREICETPGSLHSQT